MAALSLFGACRPRRGQRLRARQARRARHGVNRQSCGGKNAVHLSIDPTGRWIVTANYSAGSVGVVPIEKDGTLGPRSDLVNLPGEPGPNRVEQASSHLHNVVFDPTSRFIAVCDKGLDRVFVFRLDAANGKLTPNDPPALRRHSDGRCGPMSSGSRVGTNYARRLSPGRAQSRQPTVPSGRTSEPLSCHGSGSASCR